MVLAGVQFLPVALPQASPVIMSLCCRPYSMNQKSSPTEKSLQYVYSM